MDRIESFSKNLRDIRKSKGWTQSQLADKITQAGISIKAATIAAYENSNPEKRKNPSMEKAIAIADALGTTLDELFGFTGDYHSVGKEKTPLNVYFFMLMELSKLYSSRIKTVRDDLNQESYVQLDISDPVFVSFFESWIKIYNLESEGTITREMSAEWVGGALQKYEKYIVENGIIKNQSEKTNGNNTNEELENAEHNETDK